MSDYTVDKLEEAKALLYRWVMHESAGDSKDCPYKDTWTFLDLDDQRIAAELNSEWRSSQGKGDGQ